MKRIQYYSKKDREDLIYLYTRDGFMLHGESFLVTGNFLSFKRVGDQIKVLPPTIEETIDALLAAGSWTIIKPLGCWA